MTKYVLPSSSNSSSSSASSASSNEGMTKSVDQGPDKRTHMEMLWRSERSEKVLGLSILLFLEPPLKFESDYSPDVSKRGFRANDMEVNIAKPEVFLARIKVRSSNITGTSTERGNQDNRQTLGNR